MNSPFPVPPGARPARRHGWGRRLVNVLVALVVVAVAAAAFVFSYDGVHAFALLGGMSARLAWFYPGLFDAVLVIACVAAVVLHDGRWWARLWAWVVALVLLAAIGTTDVLHATGITLRHRPTEGVVAGAPVVAVLLAFSLLLTVLRQSRGRAVTADVIGYEPARAAVPAGLDVPALSPAEPATVALAAAPVVESPAVTAPPAPGATLPEPGAALPEPPAPGTPRPAGVPAHPRVRLPESPIALPAGPRADPARARGEAAGETAAAAVREVPQTGIRLPPDTVRAGDIRLSGGPVPAPGEPAAEPPSRADAIPVTPPDGLPVMRRTAAHRPAEVTRPPGAPRRELESAGEPVPEPRLEPAALAADKPAATRGDDDADAAARPHEEAEAAAGPVTGAEPAAASEPEAASGPAAAAGLAEDTGPADDTVPSVDPGPADGTIPAEAAGETGPAEATGPVEGTEPEPEPEPADGPRPAPAARPVIRYAGSGSTGRSGRALVAEPEPGLHAAPVPSAETGDQYWDGDDSRQYAGLVYTAGVEETDEPQTREAPGPARRPAAVNGDDTPPFTGGVYTPAARLNRVRSMPAPPDDEDE